MFNWVTEMQRHAMVSDMPDGLSVQPPSPSRNLAAQLRFLFYVQVRMSVWLMLGLFKALYVIANHKTSIAYHFPGKQGAGEKLSGYFLCLPLPQKQRWRNQSITCSLR